MPTKRCPYWITGIEAEQIGITGTLDKGRARCERKLTHDGKHRVMAKVLIEWEPGDPREVRAP